MQSKERVVVDAYIIKGALGVEYHRYDEVFLTMQKRNHILIINSKLVEKYSKAIRCNDYAPRGAMPKLIELCSSDKVASVDEGIEKMEESNIKIKIEDEDDIPFVKAAIAARAKYFITEDGKHLLPKKEEFKREYQIEVLTPEEYIKEQT
jgi:predicted nucleic acid-binding protein